MDAAHFVHQAYLGYVWSREPLSIASPSGRERYNVLGALNATRKDIITVCNEKYINAESVCHLLCKLSVRRCPDMKITVVLDNAKYQKCAVVGQYASELGIELLYLPSYSPNLNLIERLWKFVKTSCLYSEYYEKFEEFKNAITNCIENQTAEVLHELETLLTCRFEVLEEVKLLS